MGDSQVAIIMSYPSLDYHTDDQSQLAYSSDDSGSFSDAYFLRSESGAFSPSSSSPFQQQHNYGAIDQRSYVHEDSLQDSALTRLVITGSILEDNPHLEVSSQQHDPPWKTRPRANSVRLQRKSIRKNQKEQEQREHLVRQVRGKDQPEEWRDILWLVLFCIQLMAILFCAVRFGGVTFCTKNRDSASSTQIIYPSNDTLINDSASQQQYESFQIDYRTVVKIASIAGLYASILTTLTVGFMLILAKSLIQSALIFTMLAELAWALCGLAIDPNGIITILGCCALALTLGYTLWVWDLIPFAATNLYTALCALRGSSDVWLLGIGMLVLTVGWCLVWSIAFIGIVDTMDACFKADCGAPVYLFVSMVFSFCWTNIVITNIAKVTVASAIGTWWFEPDSMPPCCTFAISKPLSRSMSTSLGSICYGSLVMMPTLILRTLASLCFLPGDTYFKTCNRWAYMYIGLYGYSFNEAGFRAKQLFETREWTSVVNDNLVHNVLWMVSVAIGGWTGTFGVLVEKVDGFEFTSFHQPMITAFIIGTSVGFVLSNVVLVGLIDSAMNTVLVCFAAGPFEFQKNHPRLSQEMRDAWTHQVWESVL